MVGSRNLASAMRPRLLRNSSGHLLLSSMLVSETKEHKKVSLWPVLPHTRGRHPLMLSPIMNEVKKVEGDVRIKSNMIFILSFRFPSKAACTDTNGHASRSQIDKFVNQGIDWLDYMRGSNGNTMLMTELCTETLEHVGSRDK